MKYIYWVLCFLAITSGTIFRPANAATVNINVSELNQVYEQLRSLQQTVNALRDQVNAIKNQVNAIKDQANALQEEIKKAGNQVTDATKKQLDQLRQLQRLQDTLTQQMATITRSVQQLEQRGAAQLRALTLQQQRLLQQQLASTIKIPTSTAALSAEARRQVTNALRNSALSFAKANGFSSSETSTLVSACVSTDQAHCTSTMTTMAARRLTREASVGIADSTGLPRATVARLVGACAGGDTTRCTGTFTNLITDAVRGKVLSQAVASLASITDYRLRMAAKRVLYACMSGSSERCSAATKNQALTLAAARATSMINTLPIAIRLGLRVNITARSFSLSMQDRALEGSGDIVSADSRPVVIVNTYTANGF